jgi:hypothetical protein
VGVFAFVLFIVFLTNELLNFEALFSSYSHVWVISLNLK